MVKEVEIDKEVQKLTQTFDELKKRVLERRKDGYDTYLSELLIRYAQPNIRMFEVSRSKEDYNKCLVLFQEIDKESKDEESRFVTEH